MTSASKPRFDQPLTDPPPIPEKAIEAALAVLRSGRLFRYGEDTAAERHVAQLEVEFARSVGARYCVATSSGGSAMFVALRATGVGAGTPVLFSAFTLAPVPGAIAHAGGEPVPVEIGDDLLVDIAHLRRQADRTGARHFLLSHMRGHIADLGAVRRACDDAGMVLIEDCAHTMGAAWDGRPTGTFGRVGCFSTQTFKHLNSGEGGLLVTDDDEVAAAAILYSGSYALYEQHVARPPAELMERLHGSIPNCSLRMSNLVAAILRPQLSLLPGRVEVWNRHYHRIARAFGTCARLWLPTRDPREGFVGSSIQFALPELDGARIEAFLAGCAGRGVLVKWFGRTAPSGFTGRREHWHYIRDASELPATSRRLATLCDLRIPLSLTPGDCEALAALIVEEANAA